MVIGILFVACACTGTEPQSEIQAFANVQVVALDRDGVLGDRTVIVREGRIEAIQPGNAVIPLGAIRIDARGKYLMPGLIDCYSHVDGETHLLPYVANGITTVKDSPAPIEHLGLRDRVARGELIGPRILCFSPDLDGEPEYPEVEAVTTPEQAKRVVAEMARLGYDGIMVYSMLEKDTYLAVLDTAAELQLPVTGHVSPRGDVVTLANGSQRSVENLVGFVRFDTGALALGEPAARHVAGLFRDGEVFCVPTLTVHKVRGASEESELAAAPAFGYFPESMRCGIGAGLGDASVYEYGGARRLVEIFHEEGVRILFGTDAGYPLVLPGFSAHGPAGELQNLVEAGLTPYEALRSATVDAAEFLELQEEIGTVSVGKRADLVLLDGNPLEAVSNAARIAGVMLNGRWYPRTELDRLMEELAASAAGPTDRFAGMAPLPTEGEEEFSALYEIEVSGYAIGAERLTCRRLSDGSRLLVSQSSVESWYATRTTLRVETDPIGRDRCAVVEREAIDGTCRLEVRRTGSSVRVTGTHPAYGTIDLEEPCAPGARLGGPILSNGIQSDMAATFVTGALGLADIDADGKRQIDFKLIELNSSEFFRNAVLGDLQWSARHREDAVLAANEASPTCTVFEVTTNGRAGRGGYDATITLDASGLPTEIRAGTENNRPWVFRRISP